MAYQLFFRESLGAKECSCRNKCPTVECPFESDDEAVTAAGIQAFMLHLAEEGWNGTGHAEALRSFENSE